MKQILEFQMGTSFHIHKSPHIYIETLEKSRFEAGPSCSEFPVPRVTKYPNWKQWESQLESHSDRPKTLAKNWTVLGSPLAKFPEEILDRQRPYWESDRQDHRQFRNHRVKNQRIWELVWFGRHKCNQCNDLGGVGTKVKMTCRKKTKCPTFQRPLIVTA